MPFYAKSTFPTASIGIGRGLTASPLPHHRTYGSRIRRFGRFSQGDTRTPTGASSPGVPAARSSQRSSPARPLAGCHLAAPRQATTPLHRSGLPTFAGGPMPSADFCGAVRADCSALSPLPGHPADLPRSAVRPSVHRRRISKVRPSCGGRTLWSRAHSSRAYHPSSPVRVPRPAPSCHAAFRPHRAVTPWRFPGPSAPRRPGRGTFTPKHDRMPGTHAGPEPRGVPRRLQALDND